MSIWLREVDKGWKDLLSNKVCTVDGKDAEGMDRVVPVPVIIRDPETEFKVERFPCVTVYCYDQRPSPNRPLTRGLYVVKVDDVTNTQEIAEAPTNWDLFYQIDFWAQYQSDIVEMTRRWLGAVGDKFSLSVVDTEGNSEKCAVSMIDFQTLDSVDGKVRTFRKSYSYRVWVQLDESIPSTEPAPEIEWRFVR